MLLQRSRLKLGCRSRCLDHLALLFALSNRRHKGFDLLRLVDWWVLLMLFDHGKDGSGVFGIQVDELVVVPMLPVEDMFSMRGET